LALQKISVVNNIGRQWLALAQKKTDAEVGLRMIRMCVSVRVESVLLLFQK